MSPSCVPLEQLLLDFCVAGHGQHRRQPVVVTHDLVRHRARLDLAGPADHAGHAVSAFPVRVLLVAERRHGPIRPGVHVRTVVGAVHDERVVGDAGVVDRLEHRADVLVVIDHRVVVFALPAAGLALAFRLDVGAEVHVREVHPDEERLVGRRLAAG